MVANAIMCRHVTDFSVVLGMLKQSAVVFTTTSAQLAKASWFTTSIESGENVWCKTRGFLTSGIGSSMFIMVYLFLFF